MGDFATDIGEGRAGFPDTNLGLISGLWDPKAPNHRAALEDLCRRYWRPVFHYVRAGWAKNHEDAKDLTQAFLLWLIESEALARYEAAKGRFRGYLKVLLQRFVARDYKAAGRQKRGGHKVFQPLSEEDSTKAVSVNGRSDLGPDEAFDRAWVQALVEDAVTFVREHFARRERPQCLEVFEAYDLAPPSDKPTYADLAKRFRLKESDVRNYLFAVREAIRQRIRSQLASMTPDVQSLEEEWAELFGS